MKLMIASDIHGSAYYCEKLIAAYKNEKADKLLILGDILYHGPRNELPKDYAPKKVIEMLNSIKDEILCVRGNCDAEVDQMVLEFPIMAEYCLLQLDDVTVFATHGHVYNMENIPSLKKGDILLHGHTHIPKYEYFGGKNGYDFLYVNPGSVSIPKGDSKCSYLIFDDKVFYWKDLEGINFLKLDVGDKKFVCQLNKEKKEDNEKLVDDIKRIVGVTASKELKSVLEEFNKMLSYTRNGMHRCCLSDPIHLEYASDDLCSMLGYTRDEFEEFVGEIYIKLIVEEDWKIFIDFVNKLALKPHILNCKYRMRCKDGTIIHVSDTMESVRKEDGTIIGYSTVMDVTEYVDKHNYLQEKASLDEHTMLPNKNCCERLLEENTNITQLTCCMMFDLNGLKLINDTKGHLMGDAAIRNFAMILRDAIGEDDFVGRFGGDEFIVILHDVNEDDVKKLIVRLNEDIEAFNKKKEKYKLSFSVGYAIALPNENISLKALLEKADYNMYIEKKAQKKE